MRTAPKLKFGKKGVFLVDNQSKRKIANRIRLNSRRKRYSRDSVQDREWHAIRIFPKIDALARPT